MVKKLGQIDSSSALSLLSIGQAYAISLKEKARNYWSDSLIERATGKILDPIYSKKRLTRLWRTTTEPENHHLGSNFFIVHNLKPNDRVKIINLSWRIGQDPLLIQTWKPNFRPPKKLREMITTI